MTARNLLLLDQLFDDIDVETAAARDRGYAIARWDGSESELATAACVLHVRTRVDAGLLSRMPHCRVIARFGTGLDTVDQDAAARRGIVVVGVRDYCIPELASHALGLAFSLDRHVAGVALGTIRADDTWQQVSSRVPLPGRRTATVIGLGSIGKAVAQALVALGITVRVVTSQSAALASAIGVTPVDLDTALAGAGFVFLHPALNAETRGMIDAARLARMSADTILINTARVGLMNETAVAAALRDRRIAGVGLDASLSTDSPLRAFLGDPRFMLTPHIGWYSQRSAQELRARAVTNAIDAIETMTTHREKAV